MKMKKELLGQPYWIMNKELFKKFGCNATLLLQHLIDIKSEFFKEMNEPLYQQETRLCIDLGLSKYDIRKAKMILVNNGLISIVKIGNDIKDYFLINEENIGKEIQPILVDKFNLIGKEIQPILVDKFNLIGKEIQPNMVKKINQYRLKDSTSNTKNLDTKNLSNTKNLKTNNFIKKIIKNNQDTNNIDPIFDSSFLKLKALWTGVVEDEPATANLFSSLAENKKSYLVSKAWIKVNQFEVSNLTNLKTWLELELED